MYDFCNEIVAYDSESVKNRSFELKQSDNPILDKAFIEKNTALSYLNSRLRPRSRQVLLYCILVILLNCNS